MACSHLRMVIQDEKKPCDDHECPQVVEYRVTRVLGDDSQSVRDRSLIALLGCLQVFSGLLSVGIGFMLAISLEMKHSLVLLFRVSHFTGMLFIVAGVVSFVQLRFSRLLPVLIGINRGCIVIGLVAVLLTVIDFAYGCCEDEENLKIEALELSMLGLQLILTVTLTVILCLEKRKSILLND
ncbi:uncharacterized protein LOC144199575 [Stigmatopora nigra]